MSVKVGVVGVGFMGKMHFDCHRANPKAEVAAICDIDEKKLAGDWSSIGGNIGDPNAAQVDLTGIKKYARLDDLLAAIKKLADGRLCSTAPMQAAITAALTGDRSHQDSFRTALRERAALTTTRLNAIDGMSCRILNCIY